MTISGMRMTPKGLQTLIVRALVCYFAVATICAADSPRDVQIAAAARTTAPDIERTVELIIARTNDFRRENGRSALSVNATLTQTAGYFASHLARTDSFSHDADGRTAEVRAEERGYRYCIVAENIAFESSSAGFTAENLARGLVEGWKRSPGHRQSMLDPDVIEIGVAVAPAANGKYYAVQMFGRPESAQIAFRITNSSNATVSYGLGERTFEVSPRQTRSHARCRTATLTLKGPTIEGTTVQPKSGDHFVIERTATGRKLSTR